MLIAAAVVSMHWQPLIGALVSGYSWAWASHSFVEKNRSATFTYPLWSLIADWRMWALMIGRKLDRELEVHGIGPKASPVAAVVKT